MKVQIKELNIVICGVGGQGVVLMSELLGNAAVRDNLKIMGSEVLGMAQRGGPVFSNIRLGSEVFAPLTPEGKCDLMAALEPSEALRNISFLSESSLVILNTKPIVPYTVYSGESKYPNFPVILEKLQGIAKKVVTLDADKLAKEAGSLQAANVAMLGALFGTGKMPIGIETVKAVITERFPAKAGAVNIKAFDLGYAASKKLFA